MATVALAQRTQPEGHASRAKHALRVFPPIVLAGDPGNLHLLQRHALRVRVAVRSREDALCGVRVALKPLDPSATLPEPLKLQLGRHRRLTLDEVDPG